MKTDRTQIENRIVDLVNSRNGMKGVELSSSLITEFLSITSNELLDIIFDLIEQGELVEIEYELPYMAYRTKSFILPKGTIVNIVNKVKVR